LLNTNPLPSWGIRPLPTKEDLKPDTRDIDGAGLKDESPYEFHELAGATKIKTSI